MNANGWNSLEWTGLKGAKKRFVLASVGCGNPRDSNPGRFISWALIPGGLIHHFNLLQVVFICCSFSLGMWVWAGGRTFRPSWKLFHLFTFITCKLSTYCWLRAKDTGTETRSETTDDEIPVKVVEKFISPCSAGKWLIMGTSPEYFPWDMIAFTLFVYI